jgi:hypothetical protein
MRGLLLALILLPAPVFAGAWTRDQGHFYVNTSYLHISATQLYSPNFERVPILPYSQHVWAFYSEVGIINRWLTATVDGTLFRYNGIADSGHTYGLGDFRVGLWTGLVTKPVRLSFGVTVGLPTGDPLPAAPSGSDADAQLVARSLPTGDGEWDIEGRLALGYAFGGKRRWPVTHYLVAEVGYWLRTAGFADSFVYKLELGTKFPYTFIERFWFSLRLSGVESFASNADAAMNATGLGNGVTYVATGVEISARIWRGLGASVGLDGALRGRSVAAALQVKAGLSYQW